jgi:hypothetical protein
MEMYADAKWIFSQHKPRAYGHARLLMMIYFKMDEVFLNLDCLGGAKQIN